MNAVRPQAASATSGTGFHRVLSQFDLGNASGDATTSTTAAHGWAAAGNSGVGANTATRTASSRANSNATSNATSRNKNAAAKKNSSAGQNDTQTVADATITGAQQPPAAPYSAEPESKNQTPSGATTDEAQGTASSDAPLPDTQVTAVKPSTTGTQAIPAGELTAEASNNKQDAGAEQAQQTVQTAQPMPAIAEALPGSANANSFPVSDASLKTQTLSTAESFAAANSFSTASTDASGTATQTANSNVTDGDTTDAKDVDACLPLASTASSALPIATVVVDKLNAAPQNARLNDVLRNAPTVGDIPSQPATAETSTDNSVPCNPAVTAVVAIDAAAAQSAASTAPPPSTKGKVAASTVGQTSRSASSMNIKSNAAQSQANQAAAANRTNAAPGKSTGGDAYAEQDATSKADRLAGIPPTAHVDVPAQTVTAAEASATLATVPVAAISPNTSNISSPPVQSTQSSPQMSAQIDTLADPQTSATMTGVLSTARLVQQMSSSEMQMGIQSSEFGKIDIHASVNQNQVSARIYVEHNDLGRTIAESLPQLHEKLAVDHRMDAQIQLYNSGSGTPYGADRQQQQQQSQGNQSQQQGLDPVSDADESARPLPVQQAAVLSAGNGLDMLA